MEVNQIIGGKYEITEVIKTGEMGSTARCINRYLQSEWLIKYLPVFNQLPDELKHLMALSHHGIPMVVDMIQDEKGVYFIMNAITGMRLNEYLTYNKLSCQLIKQLMLQLSEIMLHVHCRGIIHGDIKAENIIISSDHQLFLVDFGSSFMMQDSDSMTLSHAAPERLCDHAMVDERSDIYSFGLVLKEILKSAKGRKLRSLRAISRKALAIRPDQRYLSMDLVQEELLRI